MLAADSQAGAGGLHRARCSRATGEAAQLPFHPLNPTNNYVLSSDSLIQGSSLS